MLKQNDFERICDLAERGEITVDDANVKKVLMQRVLLVQGKIPAFVRKALNAAVKSGVLGHMKKDGHKPEVYYHPSFKYLAHTERQKNEDNVIHAVRKIAGWPG